MVALPLLLGLASLTGAQERAFVAAAQSLMGVRYQLGGRLKDNQGVDCQGILFFAAERMRSTRGRRCGWKSYDVMPSTAIPRGELGTTVVGPTPAHQLDWQKLRPADVVWLLAPERNPKEPAVGTLGGQQMWVWHTGLISRVDAQGAVFLNADPFSGAVMEMDLKRYMTTYGYAGVVITRMKAGPAPARCRRHRPMRPPAQ